MCIGSILDGTRMTFDPGVRALPAMGLANSGRVSTLPLLHAEPSIGVPGALLNSYVCDFIYVCDFALSPGQRLPSVPWVKSLGSLNRVDGTVQNAAGDRK